MSSYSPRVEDGLSRRASALAGSIRSRWHLAIPALVTAGLAVHAGGFFPDAVGVLAVLLLLLFVGLITLCARPLSGWSPALGASACALFLLSAWTLLSAAWSDAPFRALSEFDRALAYALLLSLSGFFATRSGDLDRVLVLVAAVIVGVATAALATRLYPATFPVTPGKDPSRLAFPITYWNALAVLCAVGGVLLVHCSAGAGRSPLVRILAAGGVPVVAVTLYFTFSRGGIIVAALGVVLYCVLASPRRLPVTLGSAVLPTVVAVAVAYGADKLATAEYAHATDEAHWVTAVVIACTVLAMLLRGLGLAVDRWLDRLPVKPRRPRTALVAAGVAVVVVGVAGVAAVLITATPATDAADRQDGSGRRTPAGQESDLRGRLTNLGSPARRDHWSVAHRAFEQQPLKGTGAGTYELEWEREREIDLNVTDAHSLYLELLGELGVPGLVFVAVALGVPLAVAARRLSGPERHAHAAFLAAGVALLVHAAIDWDWEMPVVFAWFLGAAGVVCAAREGPQDPPVPGRLPRVLAAMACLALATTPASVALSQGRMERAVNGFVRGDCAAATSAALDSLGAVNGRPEPFELLGYCDIRAGERRLAVEAMRAAQRRDPGNWQYAYGLAVARALDDQNPLSAAARALQLNPRSKLARDLRDALRAAGPQGWGRAAARAQIPRE